MINTIFHHCKSFRNSSKVFLPLSWKSLSYYPIFKFSVIEEGADASKLLEEVEGKVLQVIKSHAPKELDQINRTASFEELGFDSLDAVDLIVTIEETLKVDIQDEEAAKIQTPNDAIALFHRYVLERFNKNKLAQKKRQKGLVVTEEKDQEIM